MERSNQKLKLLDYLLQEEGIGSPGHQAIRRRQHLHEFPLSFAQKGFWFLNNLEPGPHYNDHFNLRFQGPLNVSALQKCLDEIVRRHEALRAVFLVQDGNPVQQIVAPFSVPMPFIDLSTLAEPERMGRAMQLAVEAARELFDLAAGPLLRIKLLRLAEQDHLLSLTVHHIAIDGWSRGIFLKELGTLYPAFMAGQSPPLPELPIQYADFAVWQEQWMEQEALIKQLAYWKQQLAGAPALLEWPVNFPRPETLSYHGARQSILIPKPVTEALKNLSQQEGCTLFMTLLAAFQTLVARYTGQHDIVLGSPIANRNHAEIEGLIGCFVNTLVFRVDLSGDPTFREAMLRAREVSLGAYANQDVPFESLVEKLHPVRAQNYNPIFQVVFIFQNAPMPVLKAEELSISPFEIDNGTAKFDLTVNLAETSEGLSGWIEYSTDLFAPDAIARLLGHYLTLLEGIVANPLQTISALPILTGGERHQLLVEWNADRIDYPRNRCIHELFEEQVARAPEAPALVFEGQELSYDELNRRANRLAWQLRETGVRSETLVAICAERSLEMVTGLLAILKAGGAYVALDPNYPPERLAFMLRDTQAPVLLAHRHLASQLPPHHASIIYLDSTDTQIDSGAKTLGNLNCGVTADHLANVIYTSGSTGKPKGTLLPHRGVVRLVTSTSRGNFTNNDVFFHSSPISFDASTWEIWVPLLHGAKLVIMSPGTPSLEALGEVIRQHKVTILFLTTGLFRIMVDERIADLEFVRQIWTGGDVLPVAQAQKALQTLPNCRLVNAYGPTENSTITTIHEVSEYDLNGNSIPIGKPIANVEVYILDRHLQPVPVGVPGELHIGGEGLARGYLNQPELTDEKFIRNHFNLDAGARLYKTGDLCRYLSDGSIEFLGRVDQQVKLRGFRIELEEIETVLGQHPAVRQAIVVAREDVPGEKFLAGYYVPHPSIKCAPEELRDFLKARLPEYMVPAAFVMLDALPLSPNGKVDRKALPSPEQYRPELAPNYAAPSNPTEQMLADIWARSLRLERVGVNDNFFDLGGHSLLIVQLHARLCEAFKIKLPIVKLFQYPTVSSFAAHLDQPAAESDALQTTRNRARLQREAMTRHQTLNVK